MCLAPTPVPVSSACYFSADHCGMPPSQAHTPSCSHILELDTPEKCLHHHPSPTSLASTSCGNCQPFPNKVSSHHSSLLPLRVPLSIIPGPLGLPTAPAPTKPISPAIGEDAVCPGTRHRKPRRQKAQADKPAELPMHDGPYAFTLVPLDLA